MEITLTYKIVMTFHIVI